MAHPLRSLPSLALFLALAPTASAQDVPGEDPGDLGSITFDLQGTPVTYTLVRAADGHVWLQQNLGSTQVATSVSDVDAYGGAYQWGRWTDGHQQRTSTSMAASSLSSNTPAGLGAGDPMFYIGADPNGWWPAGSDLDTWAPAAPSTTNGIDPCVALGLGWQLPSRLDWVDLLAAENITGTASAFASNLKLPAAGSRDGASGTLINAGAYGNYWTSTPNTVYAKDITIGDVFVNPDDDAYRSYGMCVRCLHKDLHTGLIDRATKGGTAVYPNPSTGTFTIDNGNDVVRSIGLYASDMRAVRSLPMGMAKGTLVLEDVPAGMYFLRIEAANGITWRTVSIAR